MKYEYQPNIKNYQEMKITSLHRYSVKGLAGDSLTSIELKSGEGTFEDDRRYALLYEDSRKEFDEENPCWVYKVRLFEGAPFALQYYLIMCSSIPYLY